MKLTSLFLVGDDRFLFYIFLLQGYLFIVLVIVFQKVIKHHQELYRFTNRMKKLPNGILFADVDRKQADKDLGGCFKYFCNNFFSNFGVEVSGIIIIEILKCKRV